MSGTSSYLLLLILFFVLIETAEQMLYRMASRDKPRWWFYIIPAIALHAFNLAIWYLVLLRTSLSVALPMIGLQYVTIALAAQSLFRERVDGRRWLGIGLIVIGFAVVASYSNV